MKKPAKRTKVKKAAGHSPTPATVAPKKRRREVKVEVVPDAPSDAGGVVGGEPVTSVFAFDAMPFLGNPLTRSRKAQVLKALVKTLGIITSALAAAGVDRSSYSKWRMDDEVFAKAADSVSEVALDFVEGKLLQNIRDGDTTAILFYLRSKGKGRGYDDRQRLVELPSGDTFTPVDFVALADLQRELPESTLDKTLTLLAEVLPPLPSKEVKK